MKILSTVIEAVSPALEMGAFEALWSSHEVSSFKQVRDRLKDKKAEFISQIISRKTARQSYKKALQYLEKANIKNFGIRVDGTVDYPSKLYDVIHPVFLLYYQGNWNLAFSSSVSVVGTRKPSAEGERRARQLVKYFVEKGFTICSGLASGIDTIVHEETLRLGGNTIAVIGTPLTHVYPKENDSLQREIAKNHLLVSQIPIVRYESDNIKFNRFYFPERNKTMSALSKATIIVEAGETSGTLIQAKAALKQRRKVFILNNCFENPQLTWPQKFEKQGAIRVRDFEDIETGLRYDT